MKWDNKPINSATLSVCHKENLTYLSDDAHLFKNFIDTSIVKNREETIEGTYSSADDSRFNWARVDARYCTIFQVITWKKRRREIENGRNYKVRDKNSRGNGLV